MYHNLFILHVDFGSIIMFMTPQEVAKKIFALGKGILAADESTDSITSRFNRFGIDSNEETRRQYRELLFSTEQIENYLSGVIMYDETARQRTSEGQSFIELLTKRGIICGIKVDQGKQIAENSPEEFITRGLEGLETRLAEYKKMGFLFAKWRSVTIIGDDLPTEKVIEENASSQAKYAKLCEQTGLVPIVEPEVLMAGDHSIETCSEVTEKNLKSIFEALNKESVALETTILKTNMVLPGVRSSQAATEGGIAEATLKSLAVVPKTLAGIVFLSGGQSEEQAVENLSAICRQNTDYKITFSFGRALQHSTMQAWGGRQDNTTIAKQIFLKKCQQASGALRGNYTA